MVEPPSFLNINDFLGTFLPGYVAVTLYLALFQYNLLFGSVNALSFDLFSAIVFIIAGPTIGATVRQFNRSLQQAILRPIVRAYQKGKDQKKREQRSSTEFDRYAIVRLKTSDAPLNELEKSEAIMDFCSSTAIVLLILGIWHLVVTMTFTPLIHVSVFVLSGILFMGAILEYKLSFVPIFLNLERLQDELRSSNTRVSPTSNGGAAPEPHPSSQQPKATASTNLPNELKKN
jgi:hypothetical protein